MPKQLMVHDDRLEAPAPVPPPAADFDLASLSPPPIGNFAPEPPAPPAKGGRFFRMLTGKFAMSLACTAIVGTCLNIDRATRAFRFVCSFAGKFADPETSTKLEKLLHKGEEAAGKVEAKADAEPKPGEPRPSFRERIVEKVASSPAVERVQETAQEAGEKARDAGERVKEGAEGVKDTAAAVKKAADTVANPLAGVGQRIGTGARAVAGKAAEVGHDAMEGAGNLRQGLAEARRQANAANARRAQCPYCGIAVHLPESASKPRGCTRCFRTYYPKDARAAAQGGGRRF